MLEIKKILILSCLLVLAFQQREEAEEVEVVEDTATRTATLGQEEEQAHLSGVASA